MSPYVRTVRTASGARAVQIVHSSRKGARSIEHIGSAHDDAELAVLKEVARQRLNAGQLSFDLPGLNSENDAGSAPQEPAGAGCVAPIASNRMGVLLEALETAWKAAGLDGFTGFRSAAGEEFPRARAALDSYAHRVTGCQQARPVPPPHPTSDTRGTEAAKVTSSTGPGATLRTEADLLTNAQARRLETLFADEHHAPVQAAWGIYPA